MSDWLRQQLARPTGDALVASVRELLGLRVDPDHIARRMGRPSTQALSQALRREGEMELANVVTRNPMADHTRNPLTQRESKQGQGIAHLGS